MSLGGAERRGERQTAIHVNLRVPHKCPDLSGGIFTWFSGPSEHQLLYTDRQEIARKLADAARAGQEVVVTATRPNQHGEQQITGIFLIKEPQKPKPLGIKHLL